MAQYKTPGVYVEEKSMLPPSVAGVATAVPAFIGYTQNPAKKGIQPVTSLLEFETIFGYGKTLKVDAGKLKGQEFALYNSMRLFYDNGGGFCYVVSIGTYDSNPSAEDYKKAIALLEEQSDVTIVVLPDAALLLKASDLASVQMQALKHCEKIGGRFAILDLAPVEEKAADDKDPKSAKPVKTSTEILTEDIKQFRDGVTDALCYGAAYYPNFKTSYTADIAFSEVISVLPAAIGADKEKEKEYADVLKKAKEIAALPDDNPEKRMRINAIIPRIPGYQEALNELQEQACVITPSGAMAGIYAATDSRVGVWQAPANVGVASVKDLTMHITDSQQENMNVDSNTAKSINAIRYFKGKGILVWGARTLDGGSNEWRYISVRRLFTYVEQSLKLSTAWAVFQPNDSNTWIKIKCQISNFLTTLWRDGALVGATSDEAFFVEVGKGVTMTEDDINNGYLRVRIGLAAVRPAEFIVLEFSHKVNE